MRLALFTETVINVWDDRSYALQKKIIVREYFLERERMRLATRFAFRIINKERDNFFICIDFFLKCVSLYSLNI